MVISVSDRITGQKRFMPEKVNEIAEAIIDFEKRFPAYIQGVSLAPTTDKRWKYHNGKEEKCNGCDIYEAGYNSPSLCKDCKKL